MSSDGKRSALSIWFLVSALVLPFLFTPQQLYRCQHQPYLQFQCYCSPDKRCWRANGVLSGTQTHILPPTARSRRYPASQKCKIVTETQYLTCFLQQEVLDNNWLYQQLHAGQLPQMGPGLRIPQNSYFPRLQLVPTFAR